MDLVKVVLDTGSKKSLDRLRKVLGDKSYQTIADKTTRRVNEIAQIGLEAYQSKVPIDGGQLRGSIRISYATPQSGVATISVSGSHKSVNRELARRFGEITQADILAQVLDIGTYTTSTGKVKEFRRRKDSQAYPGFSSAPLGSRTKDWIIAAKRAFGQARRKVK